MIYLIVLNILRTLFDKIIVFYSFLKFVIKFAFYSILLKIREKIEKKLYWDDKDCYVSNELKHFIFSYKRTS